MKKRFCLFLSLLCTFSFAWSTDYFQLQNSDFEEWETQNGGDEPVMWNTYATAGRSFFCSIKISNLIIDRKICKLLYLLSVDELLYTWILLLLLKPEKFSLVSLPME